MNEVGIGGEDNTKTGLVEKGEVKQGRLHGICVHVQLNYNVAYDFREILFDGTTCREGSLGKLVVETAKPRNVRGHRKGHERNESNEPRHRFLLVDLLPLRAKVQQGLQVLLNHLLDPTEVGHLYHRFHRSSVACESCSVAVDRHSRDILS